MNKCLFVILGLFVWAEAVPRIETPVRYDGAQVWSVKISYPEVREMLNSLSDESDIAIWNENHDIVDVLVKQPFTDQVREALEDYDISYSVKIEDLQKLIELESPPQDKSVLKNNVQPVTWSNYHSTEDIFKFLDYLVEKHPNLCSIETIGNSYENRPLKVLKISNGNAGNKAIWIDGGIHAREWVSPASVTYIVNDLVENWDSQPEHIKNVNWYVLPVHNPDGYEYTRNSDRLWRKNRSKKGRCSGVDLNRNYGYKWGGKGTSGSSCNEIYRGPNAFSEPETQAVKNFFENTNEKFDAFLTFHSYGQYILHPWGYDTVLTDDKDDLSRVGKEAAKNIKALDNQVYAVGSSAILLYPAAGGSDDWAKSLGIKYSYTVELRDKGRYGFVLPPQFIEPTAKEAREFVFTVAQAIAN